MQALLLFAMECSFNWKAFPYRKIERKLIPCEDDLVVAVDRQVFLLIASSD